MEKKKNSIKIIDPEIKSLFEYLYFNYFSLTYKKIFILSILGPLIHIIYTFDNSFGNEVLRFLQTMIIFMFVLTVAFGAYNSLIFFIKRNSKLDLNLIAKKMKNSRRSFVVKLSPNILLVKVNFFQSYRICYKDSKILESFEQIFSKDM